MFFREFLQDSHIIHVLFKHGLTVHFVKKKTIGSFDFELANFDQQYILK